MAATDTVHPAFTIALRGYDRAQVEEYIEELQRQIAEAEERVREAATEYVFDAHAAIGPRVAEIFALAEAEARELRERVTVEAAELIAAARTEAQAIVDAAERIARETNERARREHAELLEELGRDRDRIREEAEALELRKAEAIGQLGRLRELLGKAARTVEQSGGPDQAPTQVLPPGDGRTIELEAVTGEADRG